MKPGSVDFNELNNLTMILVAPFDIFGYGLYRYTFEEYCYEVPGLKLNDGARIRRIHERVSSIRQSEKMGVKLMQAWEEKIYDKMEARAEGLAEGRAEGLAEGLAEGKLQSIVSIVCRKLRRGFSMEDICDLLEEEECLVGPMYEVAAGFAPDYDEEKVWEAYMERRKERSED